MQPVNEKYTVLANNARWKISGRNEHYYGFLTFDGSLKIAYRSSEDDLSDAENGFEFTYTPKDLDKCDPAWLRAVTVDRVMNSLASNLIAKFDADISETQRSIRVVETAANLPHRELEVGIVDVATKLGYAKVLEQWQKAQSALAVDAGEAIARASQLIETLCKHILESTNQAVPHGTPDLQGLYRAASGVLALSPDCRTSEALTRMGSGFITLILAIGTLRNHASIAHGSTSSSVPVTFSEARLAVNSAGVLATFLMDAMVAKTQAGT